MARTGPVQLLVCLVHLQGSLLATSGPEVVSRPAPGAHTGQEMSYLQTPLQAVASPVARASQPVEQCVKLQAIPLLAQMSEPATVSARW
jgi:hypothetical protein